MEIDGMELLARKNPNLNLWQSKITVKLIRGFRGFCVSRRIQQPSIFQENEPAIVWIKDGQIVFYLLFPYVEHSVRCFRRLMEDCYNAGAKVMPYHKSFVGEQDVIFTWGNEKEQSD